MASTLDRHPGHRRPRRRCRCGGCAAGVRRADRRDAPRAARPAGGPRRAGPARPGGPRRRDAGGVRGTARVRRGCRRAPGRASRRGRAGAAGSDRASGAGALRRLQRALRPAVDVDRAARRGAVGDRALLHPSPRPGARLRKAGVWRAAASWSSRPRRPRRCAWRLPRRRATMGSERPSGDLRRSPSQMPTENHEVLGG